jgi:O-antigen ligase
MISTALGSGADHRTTGPAVTAFVLVVVAAVVAGIGAGLLGWPLLIVLAALPVAGAVFYRPFFGVVLLAATIPMENILNFDGLGLGRAIGLTVFGAWFVQKIATRQSWHRVVSGGFFPAAMGFLIWILASMLWAEHRPVVRTGFIRIAQMVALALIVIDLVDSRRKLDLIAKAVVLSALVAAATILYQAEILNARRLGSDISGGINNTAAVLVTVIPLAFYLLRASRSFIWGLIGTLYLGMGAVSVAIMTSRLNLLLLPPLIGILYLLTARERRGRRWLVAVTVAGALGATLFVPWDKLAERAATIGAYVDQTAQFGQVQAETSPRGYHLRIGLAIARDHPIIGVGYGNYGYFFRDEYQFQVAGADKLYGSVRSPHSAYLGIAADLGAIGLAVWLLLLGLCATSAIRTWLRARAAGVQDLLPLIEALVLMLGLHVFAYGFYAPNQVDKLLWLIMAMCIAVGYVVAAETAISDSSQNSGGSGLGLLVSGPLEGSSRRAGG